MFLRGIYRVPLLYAVVALVVIVGCVGSTGVWVMGEAGCMSKTCDRCYVFVLSSHKIILIIHLPGGAAGGAILFPESPPHAKQSRDRLPCFAASSSATFFLDIYLIILMDYSCLYTSLVDACRIFISAPKNRIQRAVLNQQWHRQP